MKTDRMTLLVTADEKADLAARATAQGISASELVRRAVRSYDPEEDMDELKALADELAAAVDRMDQKLDTTFAKLARHEKALADKEGLKAAARADLEASGEVWPFDLPSPARPAP